MFTGIVQGLCEVCELEWNNAFLSYAVDLEEDLTKDLKTGASIAIDGTCQTVTRIEGKKVWFDAISETLEKTTLKSLKTGKKVNVERSLFYGQEIGGHLLSGHVNTEAQILEIKKHELNCVMFFGVDKKWMKYLLPKGFVALDGASLTLVDCVEDKGTFSVHLIPETLNRTTLGIKEVGDRVNVEIDSQTLTIVETVERLHAQKTQ